MLAQKNLKVLAMAMPASPIELHPSSPPSRLQSPEPSGTPDLRRLSSHREITTFGYGYGMLSIGGGQASASFSQQRETDFDCMEAALFPSSIGQKMLQSGVHHSNCSISDAESKDMDMAAVFLADSNLDGVCESEEIHQASEINLASPTTFAEALPRAFSIDNENNKSHDHPKAFPPQDCTGVNIGLRNNRRKSKSSSDNEWDVHPTTTSRIQQVEGHYQSFNNGLRSCPQEEQLVGRMHAKFLDLVEKITSLHGNPPLKVSSSVSIPLKSHKTVGTIVELQKKVEDLKSQVIEERSQRQAVARQLNNFRRESKKGLQQKQKSWENKFRELQKEKYTLSMRLQKLQMESPRQRLAQGGDVHLTEEDMKRLRQEIEEQESLIRGYQIENERAIERLREIQTDVKEKEHKMAEENAALASQLACLQAKLSSGESKLSSGESLTDSLTLRGGIQNAQARDATLMSELEKIESENKVLKNKIIDLEDMMRIQGKCIMEYGGNKSDASCQCLMNVEKRAKGSMSAICELSDIMEINGSIEGQKLETLKNKENFVNYSEVLQTSVGKDQKRIQCLQNRMEKMKRDYDLKIRDLKQQIEKKSIPSGAEKASTKKVKYLETQISQIRSSYPKKIKDLTGKADANKEEKKSKGIVDTSTLKGGLTPKKSMVQALKNSQERVVLLENILAEKTATIKHLEAKLLSRINERVLQHTEGLCQLATEKKEISGTKNCNMEHSSSETCLENCKEDEALGNSLGVMADKGEVQPSIVLNRTSASLLQNAQAGEFQGLISSNIHYQTSRREFSSEPQAEVEKTKCKKSEHINVLEARQQDMKNECKSVQDMRLLSMNPNIQLQILQTKMLEMESRQNHRELEWQALLLDTKRLLNLEHDMAERKWNLAMEAKNAEIECFKLELDTILEVAIKIQKAQLKLS